MTAEGACDLRTGFMGRMCQTCGRDDFGGPDHPSDCPNRLGGEMDNSINTWCQGRFIDQRRYDRMGEGWKALRRSEEEFLVRPSPTGNAICRATGPSEADWIAQRLNLASVLEQMTYDYATGKTDGSEIVAFVRKSVE